VIRLILRDAHRPAEGIHCRPASAANFRIADVVNDDRTRPEAAGFQGYPPRPNGGLGEAGPGSLLEPGQELIERHVVNAFRDWRGDAVEQELLQFLPLSGLFNSTKSVTLSPFNGRYRLLSHVDITSWTADTSSEEKR
jgi:hypothetical protein